MPILNSFIPFRRCNLDCPTAPNGLPVPRLRKLGVVIAVTTLLNACGALQKPLEETSATNSVDLESPRTIGNRNPAARVSIAPGNDADDEIVIFNSLWDRIGSGLQFSFQYDNERIDKQVEFYRQNTNLLKVASERANFFLFDIVEELDRRGLPLELALLPIMESGYNPNAVGASDTVGLWQIIAATGLNLGLKRDWWYDGRRDPIASTIAALDYLEELHQMFEGDWLLALAAYNSGEGTVRNAIEQNSRLSLGIDYWSLNLPSVTEEYIPKLIALGQIFAAPNQSGLDLSVIKNERIVTAVNTGGQIDISLAASIAGLDADTVYQLNPGFRQWATHPDGPHTLMLPIDHAENFVAALSTLEAQARVTWDRYVVQPGDTLGKIAIQFGTQVAELQQANDIEGSRIVAGESLLIPRGYTSGGNLSGSNTIQYVPGVTHSSDTSKLTAPTRYEVQSGDSLWRIAARFNLTTEMIAQWNSIDMNAVLLPGQILTLAADFAVARTDANAVQTISYQVRAGDSLSRIARQFGVTIKQLATWNNIVEGDLIHPGQQLELRPEVLNLN